MHKPKIIKLIVYLIITVCLVSFTPLADQSVGNVTFPLGNVLVLSKGETRLRKVTFNMPVISGDKIETKKTSRCEITYHDGSIVRIDEQSIYTVENALISEEKKQVESTLSIGKLWANIKKFVQNNDSWRLKSPAAVVAVRGTVYRMNSGADSSTQVLVYDGNVAISPAGPAGTQPRTGVTPGPPRQVQGPVQVSGPTQVSLAQWIEIITVQQQIVIRPDGSYVRSDFNMEEDANLEWVDWNKNRDALLD
jgi:hypothetical protein